MISDHLKDLLAAGLQILRSSGLVPAALSPPIEIGRPGRPEHGEFSSNLPLVFAGSVEMPARKLAAELIAALPASDLVEKVEVAGPGFINFHLSRRWLESTIHDIAELAGGYGRQPQHGERVQIEFVSANPTGPLHVGSGRNAAYGDALARLLEAAGSEVSREYFINDAGKQMERFAGSLHARYLQALGRDAQVPEDGYHGDYLAGLGKELAAEHGEKLVGDPRTIGEMGTRAMVEMHRRTLERFRVVFDSWVSEKALHETGKVRAGLDRLIQTGHTFEADGALWIRSSGLGAARDQVLIRSDAGSSTTYLAADVAYLIDKLERGFDRVIYVWGADHHGNVAGLEAVARALGISQPVEILLQQLVNFITPGGHAARMSKRAGTIVTVDQLIDEVGVDAARFTLVSRSIDATIDFDLELVKSESPENPVYYVQYQHARACSILRNALEEQVELIPVAQADLSRLNHEAELQLIRKLSEYPELIVEAARLRAPHRLAHYAQSLAALFSAFYRDCRVLSNEVPLTQARLWLVRSTRQVIANALDLIGVSAPEKM